MISKRCRRCQMDKPLDRFYRHPMARDRHAGICIECQNAAEKARRQAHGPEMNRRRREAYARRVLAQNFA